MRCTAQQVDLARRLYGELHPAILQALLDDADHANNRNDCDGARKRLEQADPLIRRAGLDRSAVGARWFELSAAKDRAQRALEASRKYDTPSAPSILQAEAALQREAANP